MRNWAWALLLVLGFTTGVHASDAVRDYYEEPGLNPFKEDSGTKNFEFIDPFSGILQLKHLDISLPGNGGLDMNVYRTYNLPEGGIPEYSAFGLGWNMQPGRLVATTVSNDICAQINGTLPLNVDAKDNPAFELPDGSRKQFYRDAVQNNTQYISQDNWRLQCQVNTNSTTYVITSPSGTRYYATDISQSAGTNITSWFVTAIQDIHGNVIQIEYTTGYPGSVAVKLYDYRVMSRMTASDGREIDFSYANQGTLSVTLDTITVTQDSQTRTWQYSYTPLGTAAAYVVDYNLLTNVRRPDNTNWSYDYWPLQLSTTPSNQVYPFAGFLQKVHYPFAGGGFVCYEYQVVTVADAALSEHFSNAVYRKTLNNCSQPTTGERYQPSWEYSYNRPTSGNDITTVDLPNNLGRIEYEYLGLNAFYPQYQGNLWKVGLLKEKRTYDGGYLIETEQDDWGSRVISGDHYQRGGTYYDLDTQVAQLNSRRIIRDPLVKSKTYTTTYQNYDTFGNPQTVTETGNAGSRTMNYTYYNNTTNWILGKTESETVPAIGTISRIFDPNNGDLMSVTRYGVTTQQYTYYPTGDLASVTDARQNTTSYSNYKRGLPQHENHPEGVSINRFVTGWGTITSETNGRGFTTSYSYDDMNRVKGITLPRYGSTPVSLSYNAQITDTNLGLIAKNARELTRGNFRQVQEHDSFGRLIDTVASDVINNSHIRVSYGYDALDRKTYETYPRYGTTSNWLDALKTIPGTTYEYDILNRITRISYPDGNYIAYTYNADDTVAVRDENGNVTTYTYRAFGDPDKKTLVQIDSPENIRTTITRNDIDQITDVWQGDTNGTGLNRHYDYDSRRFLNTITNPETGLTTLTFDDAGNMTGKQVGNAGVAVYGYDGLNRLKTITYPGTTPMAVFGYDGNNNVISQGNTNTLHTYQYDQNDNLLNETIIIGSDHFGLDYTYDSLDNLNTIAYPLGRTINYAPDVFGRPTQAMPYVNSVYYYASGQIDQIVYQNGIVTNYALDSRLRVKNIHTEGLAPLSDLTYDYYPNGNVQNITNGVESQYSRSFTYDGMNRLRTASGNWGNAAYNYDTMGNLIQRTVGSDDYVYNYDANNLLNTVTLNGNSLYTFAYDAYGNISNDNATRNIIFDDAQNLVHANLYNVNLTNGQDPNFDYLYDANNMRVSRTNNGITTHYLYAKNGNLLAEMQSNVNEIIENFYLGTQRIASIKGAPQAVANAGADQAAQEGTTVTLDGSGTTVPPRVSVAYNWQQISGLPVQINNSNSPVASFTLPAGVYYGNQELKFKLTVSTSYVLTVDKPTIDNRLNGICTEILNAGYPSCLLYKSGSSTTYVTDLGSTTSTTAVSVQIVDADNDGLSDVWEQKYFGDTALYGASADPTGDGFTMLQDYQLGLDPTVPQPLQIPEGMIVKPGINQNTIYWLPVDRALSYDLYWSTTPNIDITTANHIDNVASPYIHSGLQTGQEYYYKLVSRNNCCSQESLEQHVIGNQRNWSAPLRLIHDPLSTSNIASEKWLVSFQRPGTNGFTLVWLEAYTNSKRLTDGVALYEQPYDLYSQQFDFVNGWGQKIKIDANLNPDGVFEEAENNTGDEIIYLVEKNTNDSTLNLLIYSKAANSTWKKLPRLNLGAAGSVSELYATLDANSKINVLTILNKYNYDLNHQYLGADVRFATASYTESGGWSSLDNLYTTTYQNQAIYGHRYASNNVGSMVMSWCEQDTTNSLKSLIYTSENGWSNITTNDSNLSSCVTGWFSDNHNVSINNNDDAMLVWGYSQDGIYAQRFSADKIEQTDLLRPVDFDNTGYFSTPIRGMFNSGFGGNLFAFSVISDIEYLDTGVAYIEIISGVDSGSAPAIVLQNQPVSGWQIPVTPIASVVSYSATNNLIPYKNDVHFIAQGVDWLPGTLAGGIDIANTTVERQFDVVSPARGCPFNGLYSQGDIDGLQNIAATDTGFGVVYFTPYLDLSCNSGYSHFMNFYWQPPGVPTSKAGDDSIVKLHDTVLLDGNGSSDDVAIVSYQWKQLSGPTISIANPASAVTSFVASAPTMISSTDVFANPIVVQLTVTDADGNLDSAQRKIYVYGNKPYADAGRPQTLDYTQSTARTITLDGSKSSSDDNGGLTYSWSITGVIGPSNPPTLTINNSNSATPTIDLPQALDYTAVYTITLTVTNQDGVSDTATTTLTLVGTPLTVDAGPDQVVLAGATVTLAGSTSLDGKTYFQPSVQLDWPAVSTQWQQVAGPYVALINAATLTPTFVAPSNITAPVLLEFRLSATDAVINNGKWIRDVVAITVQPTSSGVATAPQVTPPLDLVVEATSVPMPVAIGSATAVDQNGNALIAIASDLGPYYLGDNIVVWSATDSLGNTGTAVQRVTITYPTTGPVITPPPDITVQSSGPVFLDIGTATATAPFSYGVNITNNAPPIFPVGVTRITWKGVDIDGNVAYAIQTVTVIDPNANQPPIANAGTDQVVAENTTVTLNGSASSDPDGTIASYQWTQTAGPVVALTGANTATATFTAPTVFADTILSFSLVVTDDKGATANASVTVTVKYVDTVAPIVSPPPDLTVEATAVLTPVNLGSASATDAVDGPLTPTPDQTGPFALGDYTITWSATDAAGNVGTATQLLTVEDTTDPVITAPDDITVTSDVPIAVTLGTPTATDIFTPITITNDAPALFPVGTTTVTWTATDPNGNTATDTQLVTVTNSAGVVLSVAASNPVTVGQVVTLSAQLSNVTGSYEYRFRIKGPATGGVWQVLRGYQTTASYDWNSSGYLGLNRLQVQARPVNTTQTPLRDGQNVWVNDVNAATSVSLDTNLPNPQFTGTAITVSAQGAGGSGTFEYQFRVKGPSTNNAWVVLQDFSASATAPLDTTGLLGQYRLQVLALNAGSADKPVKTGLTFWLNALDALTGVSLNATPASPQPVGTLVTLNAAPTSGGNGTYVYRFRIKGPATGGVWQVLQDWSSSATYPWNTTGYPGANRLQVQAVNANASDKPVRHGLNFSVQ